MARTVAARREAPLGPYPDRQAACTFCTLPTDEGVRHDLCPGETHTNPGRKDDRVWTCQCWKERHPHEAER